MAAFGPPTTPAIHCSDSTQAYWQGQSLVAGTQVVAHPDAQLGFTRLTWQWGRNVPTGVREDIMVSHLDFCHTDIGVATPLSTTERAELEAACQTQYSGIANRIPTGITLIGMVWHDYLPINSRPGPADRTTTLSILGTQGASRQADQLAITTTYKTPSRRHWGRSYWPFGSLTATDSTYGRINNTFVDAFATFVNGCFSVPGAGNGITPVVASVQYKAVMTVQTIQCDNIYDVIRSRRAKFASYKKTFDGT